MAEKLIQEGIEIGETRGEKRGVLKTKREAIIRLMKIRFDSVPETVVKKIKSIRSMDGLNALFDNVALAQSIAEIEMD